MGSALANELMKVRVGTSLVVQGPSSLSLPVQQGRSMSCMDVFQPFGLSPEFGG